MNTVHSISSLLPQDLPDGRELIEQGRKIGDDVTVGLSLLCEQRTPLELCPLSNVATGVIKSLVDHPVRRYWDQGLLVTINTDDPGMFHNKLVDEYVQLVEIFHFELDEIRSLILNALESSWRPEMMSPTLPEIFSNHPGWQLPN